MGEVQWQQWRMRLGFTSREGLVLHTVGYQDQGKLRSVLYRASLVEMTVFKETPVSRRVGKTRLIVASMGSQSP